MAALVSHIPDRGGQTVRYYGFYSNATRGRLKKEE
ncbi:MAG: transposase, partial [Actinobacteria bacterium]|nr:transposase [Actinomycetota bacterium]